MYIQSIWRARQGQNVWQFVHYFHTLVQVDCIKILPDVKNIYRITLKVIHVHHDLNKNVHNFSLE